MNDEIKVPTMQVTPLKKICMTIGELPTSYLETMSYYEMLVWFTNYLRDNIIPVVNNNGEATHELQVLFTELQSYVNNYFDNLDVQDEINNKLDEMAESGQLTDIIAQYLGLAGMIAFDNVASMKLAENLVNGSKCHTLGYYTAGDGGSSLYKVRAVTNEDVVDEKTIIALYDNTLVAEIVVVNSISPEQVGAKGDNETDDTTAIQTAINYANTKGIKLNFMEKTYLVTDSITLYSDLYIEGNNGALKILVNKPLFVSGVISGLHINNLKLVGANNSEYTNNIGMKLICFWSKFTNMRITSFYQGIFLDTTGATGTLVENVFDTITFSNCNMSFYGGTIGNNKITDGYLTNIIVNNADSTQTAVAIGSGAGWVVKNIHIYGSCNNGLSVLNCFYTTIDSIYVENALSSLLNLSLQNTAEISNISGRLRHSGNIGIRLDRTSYHSDITSANISNVYLSVEADATASYGIRDVSTALKLNITNFIESISESVTNYTKISGSNPNYIGNAYITERLYTDTSGVLNYRDSRVGLSYKHSFSGSSEITLQIPLNNNVYSYSMSKINIYMISKQNWNGTTAINYSVNLIMIDKAGTKYFAKVNETGNNTGFTTAPTFTYNSNSKTIDVTFTPNASNNGFLFADIV